MSIREVPMKENTYFAERLNDQINWYDNKSVHCQRKFKQHRLLQIVAAALLPVVAIISAALHAVTDIDYHLIDSCFRIGAGVFGAAISISVSISTLCKYHENWIEYRTTAETLQHEKYLYLAKVEPYAGKDAFPRLVEKVESIISKENSQWHLHQHASKTN